MLYGIWSRKIYIVSKPYHGQGCSQLERFLEGLLRVRCESTIMSSRWRTSFYRNDYFHHFMWPFLPNSHLIILRFYIPHANVMKLSPCHGATPVQALAAHLHVCLNCVEWILLLAWAALSQWRKQLLFYLASTSLVVLLVLAAGIYPHILYACSFHPNFKDLSVVLL